MSILRTFKIKKIQEKYFLNKDILTHYLIKRDGLLKQVKNIEYLFLGSSHCELAVNTNCFENNKAYNLGLGSQDLYYSFELYKKFAPILKNLKKIFVFYSVFSSGYELEKSMNKHLVYFYDYVFNIKPYSSYPYGDLSKELKFLDKIKGQIYIPKGFAGYKESTSPFDEGIALRDIKGHLKNAFRGNNQQKYINEIENIAKLYGHCLCIIIPPHAPTYRAKAKEFCIGDDYNKIFFPLYALKNKCILNYFDNKNFSDEDFMDWEHLLPQGAIKFTNKFIKTVI